MSKEIEQYYLISWMPCCGVQKQQIALRGHRDDQVQFAEQQTSNEGNFIAIHRLLADSNPSIKEHLIS